MACCDRVRDTDLFGVPISLVYKGERLFRTRLGGCVSLFFIILILLFAIEEIFAVKVLGRGF